MAESDESIRLPTFTVSEDGTNGYAATNSISATKIATELKNLPFTIDVITEEFFKDFGLTEVYDIAALSAGVSTSQRQNGTLESYTVRGFTTYFSSRNGNTNFRTGDSANVARVEVVTGPMSVLYGQVDPGGIANTITKQPSAIRQSNVRLETGSWDYYRAELGTTGPLNRSRSLTYRIDASALDRDGYRDYDTMKKYFVAPVIRWSPRPGTSATFDLEYIDLQIVGLGNWPRYVNRPANDVKFSDTVPRTFNLQGPGLGAGRGSLQATSTLEHRLTDNLVVRNVAGITEVVQDLFEAAGTTVTTSNPAVQTMSRSLKATFVRSRAFSNSLNLAGRYDFGQRHYTRFVAGWDYVASRSTTDSGNSAVGTDAPTPPSWNLADPATWNRTVPNMRAARITTRSGAKFWEDKFYFVDSFAFFNERLMLLGGLNYSKVENISYNYIADTRLRVERDRWTPQSGVILRVTPALGLYANYSESFRQITTLRLNQDRSMTPFDPLIAKGLDAGFKYDFVGGRFSGQLTAFKIVYENARQAFTATDSIGNYTYEVQTGESTSDGFESRITANVTKNWQVIGGYSYADARVTKNPANLSIVGRWLPRSPMHSANLSTSYRIVKGPLARLSMGGTVSYRSQAKAFETTDPYFLDPRVLVNVRVGYSLKLFGKPATLNLLVNNVFDEKYFPSSIGPGDPTSWRFSIDQRF